MNTINLTPVIQACISLVAVVITAFLIPWIKTKVTAQQLETLNDLTFVAVRAAEVLFKGTKLGKDKLEYVTKYLNEMCEKYGYDFDEVTIRQTIENAVSTCVE